MSDHTTKLYNSILAQPGAVRELLQDWDGPTKAAHHLLSAKRIFLAGIGTSYHAAVAGEYLLRLAGGDAWGLRSFDFANYPRSLESGDAVIVISHRGGKRYARTTIAGAADAHVLTIGITGKNSTMEGPDLILETVEQDPSSTFTISYIGALVRLSQIAIRLASLGGKKEQATRLEEGLEQIPTLMEQILQREHEVRQVAQEAVSKGRRLYFIGAGPNAVTAPEGALKAKEAAYVTTEGFEIEQAIHGPLVAFESEDLIIPINVKGAAQARMADLLLGLSEIDTRVWLIGDIPGSETGQLFQRPGWAHFPVAAEVELPEELTPLLTTLPVQLLADFLAAARGTNADSFRTDQEAYKRAISRFQL